MGPTYFLMIHMQQLIRAIVLVGEIPNEFVKTFLCVKISPYDFILLPDKWQPIEIKKVGDKREKDKYEQAGYKVKVTLYYIGILAA